MDGMTRVDLQGVVAPLNFMVPMAEKPYSDNYDPPPGVPVRNGQMIEHKVTVRDARPVNDALSLDREGFVLLRHQTAATDLYDETIITSVYYPECERLMKEATGARREAKTRRPVHTRLREGLHFHPVHTVLELAPRVW